PASRRTWRVQLQQQLKDLREWLDGSSHGEREELEAAIRLLETTLPSGAALGGRGWVAFISDGHVHQAAPLPVAVPTRAVWSTGMCIAPYMRALKESRPVAVAVVDATKAHVYAYRVGELKKVETVRAHHAVMQPSHMGNAASPGFHSGTRGAVGRDEAQRSLLEGTDRMRSEAAELLGRTAGEDGWIVIGGIPRESAALTREVSRHRRDRVLQVPELDIHASRARIADLARAAASMLRDTVDAKRIAQISDEAAASGQGAVGPAASRAALDQHRVRELYITRRYLLDHALETEASVRSALDQGAIVEEVSGGAAAALDARGGMAAQLRYRLAEARAT
ncbi:MAG TPA: hypothetical protein VFT29_20865, partial [Gemmatimonadaceae bacterium]|nr:hypothetical protein [Gemmatimonadaceae bacterium]